MQLFPGMTAYVTIPIANASAVLKVPNGALRFTPDLKPAQLQQIQQKYGITPVGRARGSGKPAGNSPQGTSGGGRAIVWKLGRDKSLEPVQIKTGITDHTYTEIVQVLKGQLQPGDELVIGSASGTQRPASGMAGPGMGRGIGR
jgi:HlyD family secretion protein